MAEVFLARMSGVGGFAKLLVIKRILPHLADDPSFVEMFVNEGRVAARLAHPNICHVYELGQVDKEVFLAMEYLDGLAWAELVPLLPRGAGAELRVAAAVLGQICEGLRYAHEYRDVDGTAMPIVHRDVSPQNLFITTEGVCKLLDFGVSKVLTEGTRTRTGMLKGKLPYMAPEQIRGEPIDARADVFSMGVVLWEALTGERLFARDSDYQIWKAITEQPIPRVTSKVDGLPPQIDGVIARALSRDVASRYPTIRAFAAELRDAAERAGGALDPPALREVLHSLAAGTLAERHERVRSALGRTASAGARTTSPASAAAGQGAPASIESTLPGASGEASITSSIELRDASVPVRRASRARSRVTAVVAGVALTALAITWWTATRQTASAPPPGATARVADPADAGPRAPSMSASEQAAADAAVGDGPPVDAGEREHRDERPRQADEQRASPPPRVGRRAATRSPPAVEVAGSGFYSVDSRPYATIVIDDRSYGATPLFKVPLPAGEHRIRATLSDGRTQRLRITIRPGGVTSSGTLAW